MKASSLDVLRACVSPALPSGWEGHLADTSPDTWDSLVDHAGRHEVSPLLHHGLSRPAISERVPPQLLSSLEEERRAVTRANERRYRHMGALLHTLAEKGVPVIALKGVQLVTEVYGSLSLRHMWDIDLLARVPDLAEVERVLLDRGYGPSDRPSIEDDLRWTSHLCPFILDEPDGRTVFEVHWTIEQPTAPFDFSVDALWERSRPTTVADAPARFLADEDLVLHLVLHATFHHGFDVTLKHLCDLAWLLERRAGALSADRLAARARRWRAHRLAHVCLASVSRFFHLRRARPFLAEVLRLLRPEPADEEIVPVVVRHVWRAAERGTPEWLVTRRMLNAWLQSVTGQGRRDVDAPPSFPDRPFSVR